MIEYEIEKVREFIGSLSDEEKQIALEELTKQQENYRNEITSVTTIEVTTITRYMDDVAPIVELSDDFKCKLENVIKRAFGADDVTIIKHQEFLRTRED